MINCSVIFQSTGAFLIPYVFSVVVGAIPMAMMEFALGQYTGQGVLTCWNIVPILKGTQVYLSFCNFVWTINSSLRIDRGSRHVFGHVCRYLIILMSVFLQYIHPMCHENDNMYAIC